MEQGKKSRVSAKCWVLDVQRSEQGVGEQETEDGLPWKSEVSAAGCATEHQVGGLRLEGSPVRQGLWLSK